VVQNTAYGITRAAVLKTDTHTQTDKQTDKDVDATGQDGDRKQSDVYDVIMSHAFVGHNTTTCNNNTAFYRQLIPRTS